MDPVRMGLSLADALAGPIWWWPARGYTALPSPNAPPAAGLRVAVLERRSPYRRQRLERGRSAHGH